MDFSKFSGDHFDVKDWINGVFQAQQDEKQREAYTATLVTKLQRYIQDMNKSLEDTSQQALVNLPRVLRDVETLKQEATFLWQQMQQVKEEIKSVEQRTSHSMQVLVNVDNVRSRVEQACTALKEADNWSSLAAAVEDVFKAGDVEAIAAQLQSMRTSLQVLKNSPDYDDKVMHLEALKNRLESSISPHIVAAFMQHKTDEAKRYFNIFTNLDRQSELRNYYLKCHRARVSSKWQEIVSGENDVTKSAEQSEVSLLGEFYELLLTVCHTEMQWCSKVFGKSSSASIVAQLLLEVALSVESGPGFLIQSSLAGTATEKLSSLTRLYASTQMFVGNLKQAIENDNNADKIDPDLLVKMSDAFWHPYISILMDYGELETEALLTALGDIPLDAHDVIDLVQLLDSSVKKLFDEALVSMNRCQNLTGFLGTCDLLSSLEKYFSEYCNRFARQLRTVAAAFGVKKGQNVSLEAAEEENWTVFQHCVRIIATCGRLLLRFGDFQRQLTAACVSHTSDHIVSLESVVSQQSTPPWKRYNYLIRVDPGRYSQLRDLLTGLHDNSGSQPLSDTKKRILEINQQAHNLAFDVVFAQVKRQLSSVSSLSVTPEEGDAIVAQSEMPMFSVSPSEHATHIGQYLMTLPQHLEAFGSAGSSESFENLALEAALRAGKLPYPPKTGEDEMSEAELDNMSDQWLGSIVRATEQTYVEAITQIKAINANAARQLVADLDYMANVVDSLGLCTSKQMLQVRELLNASEVEDFRSLASASPHRIASVIASMRQITL